MNLSKSITDDDELFLSTKFCEHPLDVHANLLRSDVHVTEAELDLLVPKFLYKPRSVIKKTIENTTMLCKIFNEAPL